MYSLLKNTLFAFGCILLLSSFQELGRNTATLDTATFMSDSVRMKDTLLLKYVPIIPTSFLMSDQSFLQIQQLHVADTNGNIIKVYKDYFSNKKFGFQLYFDHRFDNSTTAVIYKIEQKFALPNKDILFYLILFILFLYGFINNISPQYFPKLFNQFSQSSLRMVQQREQLLQNSVGSFLSNLNFILSIALVATLLIFNYHLLALSFWMGYFYICLFFTALYLVKFMCLHLAGYIFNTQELVNTYIFVVFMINKVLGVLLMPFVLFLAFAKPVFYTYALFGVAIIFVILILYRYLFSLSTVRNKLHISSFHFFLYLCAFELLPLMLLYKFIVQYFGGTY